MCSLLLLLDADPDFPILVAANRDERRDRKASPPGLYVGARRRILSPRDRRAGGTWMGVNDRMWFAGLANVAGGNNFPDAVSRGGLPHLALDQDAFADVAPAIAAAVAANVFNDFQLLVTDGAQTVAFRHVGRELRVARPPATTLTLTNEHDLDQFVVPELEGARAPGLTVEQRLDLLAAILRQEVHASGHRILKGGNGPYGTVSSSLVAVPRRDPLRLVWRYAAGPPDVTPYRDYGNLGRRLSDRGGDG
jgi:hypothetical protein